MKGGFESTQPTRAVTLQAELTRQNGIRIGGVHDALGLARVDVDRTRTVARLAADRGHAGSLVVANSPVHAGEVGVPEFLAAALVTARTLGHVDVDRVLQVFGQLQDESGRCWRGRR